MARSFDPALNDIPGSASVKPAAAWCKDQQDLGPVVTMPINALQCSDSPRLAGENGDHVRVLAESETVLPPIIVHSSTMRVIDGMHRLRAAILRGQNTIKVQFFEGDERDSFLLAVEANIKHGLPLTLAERTAAAARIVSSHPQLSDRAITSLTGLAARTVSAIRRRSTADNPQLNSRVGRDGRIRPLNAAEGRKIAADLMTIKPNASLREVASAAGISLGTAQDVRKKLRCGSNPVAVKPHGGEEDKGAEKYERSPSQQHRNKIADRSCAENGPMTLHQLRGDPSLRFTSTGRNLIRLLYPLGLRANEWTQLIHDMPHHCTHTVANAADACAQVWQEFADRLRQSRRDDDRETAR